MPFNPKLHSSVGYVSIKHKAKLKKLAKKRGRTMRIVLEDLIDQAS